MPSWNIHIAHAERLLAQEGAAALGVRDVDAFLLGNVLPDIYVGYMVPDATRKIEYAETHFADPCHVPEPRYEEFFGRFAAPSADAQGRVSDVVLGAWAHLVADHEYNLRFNRLLAARGLKPGTEVRIRKQADFDTFGRTLKISLVPRPTAEAIAQCAAFPQYAVVEEDVRATCKVMAAIVRKNAEQHVDRPIYHLLGEEYFSEVPAAVDAIVREGLGAYARGDKDWGRLR